MKIVHDCGGVKRALQRPMQRNAWLWLWGVMWTLVTSLFSLRRARATPHDLRRNDHRWQTRGMRLLIGEPLRDALRGRWLRVRR